MRNGFRLAGHPAHAALSHFPLALLATSVIFDAVGLWREESICWTIGFWNIVLGLVLAVPTAVTGFIDYVTIVRGPRAERTATIHMIVMLTAVTLFGLSLLARGGQIPQEPIQRFSALALDAAGALLICAGGWFGGDLILRYSVGLTGKDVPPRPPRTGD